MSINAPTKGGDKKFDPPPAGNHIARVYSIIHIGTLKGEYMGEPKETDTVRIGFELPNETKVFKEGEEPRPFVVSREYTNSMGEKANLRKLVEGIIGAGLLDKEAEFFDVTQLIGETCMLNVIHKTSKAGNEYAHILSAAPLPKGVKAPAAMNQPFILDFSDNWSEEKLESLPDFLKEKIRGTPEYVKTTGKVTLEGGINPDDIPF
jgi:hypothetical protein